MKKAFVISLVFGLMACPALAMEAQIDPVGEIPDLGIEATSLAIDPVGEIPEAGIEATGMDLTDTDLDILPTEGEGTAPDGSIQAIGIGVDAEGNEVEVPVTLTPADVTATGTDSEGNPIEVPVTIEPITAPVIERSELSLTLQWISVAVAVIVILLIAIQEKGTGLSSTFGGTGGFYASKRGIEKTIYVLTIILALCFVALNLVSMWA